METTGLAPGNGDRVVEVAIARLDRSGKIEDEYATLINPEGRDVGTSFYYHHISNERLAGAPLFSDIAGEILCRLDGAVAVAHNATFDERFLAAEFTRAGVSPARGPGLCSLWLARQTMVAPNHKLATLCRHAGIVTFAEHSALGDVRALAEILPHMLDTYGPVGYPLPVVAQPHVPKVLGRPWTRAAGLRKGEAGWMSNLLARLPLSAADADDSTAEAYLNLLSTALEDGRLVGDEARGLAFVAGLGGLGAMEVAALNERFLESMRKAAFDDEVLTAAELRQLTRAALLLGADGYFDDLTPTAVADGSPTGHATPPANQGVGPAMVRAERQRRCGYCRQPGHYRPTCPRLGAAGVDI